MSAFVPTGPRGTALAPRADVRAVSLADVRRRAESRLRAVCAGWPAEQFATLIADVVRFHERWDLWEAAGVRDRS